MITDGKLVLSQAQAEAIGRLTETYYPVFYRRNGLSPTNQTLGALQAFEEMRSILVFSPSLAGRALSPTEQRTAIKIMDLIRNGGGRADYDLPNRAQARVLGAVLGVVAVSEGEEKPVLGNGYEDFVRWQNNISKLQFRKPMPTP